MRANATTLRTVLVAVAGGVVWFAAGELEWPARAFTTFLLVILPASAVGDLSLEEVEPETLQRVPVYLSSAAALLILAALAVGAASGSGILPALGIVMPDPVTLLAWTGGAMTALLALAAVARWLGARESPILLHLLPRTGRERTAFLALALAAGVGEEIAFRGFLIPALSLATGLPPLAVVLSAGVFGFLHAYQGRAGAARAGAMGLLLTVPFLVTGSLVPSILAHFLYDVVAGVWLGPWIARRG